MICNLGVVGSNPTRGSKENPEDQLTFRIFRSCGGDGLLRDSSLWLNMGQRIFPVGEEDIMSIV